MSEVGVFIVDAGEVEVGIGIRDEVGCVKELNEVVRIEDWPSKDVVLAGSLGLDEEIDGNLVVNTDVVIPNAS